MPGWRRSHACARLHRGAAAGSGEEDRNPGHRCALRVQTGMLRRLPDNAALPVGASACLAHLSRTPDSAVSHFPHLARSASMQMRPAASPHARTSSRCRRKPLRQCADAVNRADRFRPALTAPSARTSALTSRLRPKYGAPARSFRARSSVENGTRGASRAVMKGASVVHGSGSIAAMRSRAAAA